MDSLKIHLGYPENPGRFQTEIIQQALDQCRDAGGGEVILGDGVWYIASLRLYSHTTLHLSSGTRLIGSEDWTDYTNYHLPSTLGYLNSPFVVKEWHLSDHYVNAMITAVEAEHVSVIGDPGALIDGKDCFDPHGEEAFRGPMGMRFCKCRCVTLRGYTIQNTGNWCHQMDSCWGIVVEDVTILGGHDGIDIHHCNGVRVENCDIRSGDDCFAAYDADDVVVKNCQLNTACNTFRFGGRNLLVENCRFWGPGEYPHRVSGRHNTEVAFMYYAMWYDDIRFDSSNWVIRNCTFENIDRIIHYRPEQEWTHLARPLHDITFENVTITGLLQSSRLMPSERAPLTLRVKNVSVCWRGENPLGESVETNENIELIARNLNIQGVNK